MILSASRLEDVRQSAARDADRVHTHDQHASTNHRARGHPNVKPLLTCAVRSQPLYFQSKYSNPFQPDVRRSSSKFRKSLGCGQPVGCFVPSVSICSGAVLGFLKQSTNDSISQVAAPAFKSLHPESCLLLPECVLESCSRFHSPQAVQTPSLGLRFKTADSRVCFDPLTKPGGPVRLTI